MPTLETREVFDFNAMSELRQGLLQDDIAQRILMLRIGGNDLMNLLGIRRPRFFTIYETPIGNVISQLVTIFRPYGFSLSAPVFEYLDDSDTLQKEMKLDLAYGLLGKTAIHPTQVPTIESAYAVDVEDYEMAISLSDQLLRRFLECTMPCVKWQPISNGLQNIINRQLCLWYQRRLVIKRIRRVVSLMI